MADADAIATSAEIYRKEGNKLCKQWKYRAAASKYSKGIALAPLDCRLWNNRAVCYAALKDWQRCMADALRVTQLQPTSINGWFLFAKALWKDGSPTEAKVVIADALKRRPFCSELQALGLEIDRWQSNSPTVTEAKATAGNSSQSILSRPPKIPSRTCSPASASTVSPSPSSTDSIGSTPANSRAPSPTDARSASSTPRVSGSLVFSPSSRRSPHGSESPVGLVQTMRPSTTEKQMSNSASCTMLHGSAPKGAAQTGLSRTRSSPAIPYCPSRKLASRRFLE